MHIALWIVQGLLAAMFLMAGMMKLTKPTAELREMVGDWVDGMPGNTVKLIGFLEVMGAIGLILPKALNILPVLTSFAAGGLVLTMLGAMALHIKRKENDKVVVNVVLMLLALVVIVGTFAF